MKQTHTKEMAVQPLDAYIKRDPGIVGGKPHIAGTRIAVIDIVIWHERMGIRADQLASEYNLSLSSIYAALAYYYDHQKEIDRSIEEEAAQFQALKAQHVSKLKQKLGGA